MKRAAESIFCIPRTAILATVMLGSVACGPVVRAQSSDPVNLRQIIDRINREAAEATWGDRTWQPTPAPSSPQPSSSSNSDRSGSSNSNSGSPGSGSLGFASMSSDGSSASVPDINSSAPSPQPSTQSNTTASSAQPNPLPEPVAAASAPAPEPTTKPRRAKVTYVAGLLTIHADDSSLNQILRQVAQLTGTTITGGVADERVFGDYGPSKASDVISTLLDGSRSNMILREGPHATLTELILTPRGGGATPPSPTSSVWDSDDDKSDGK